ncbi:uncharacterized protein BO80DRAFT_154394 [Aspergillus ibericus CBS 121593]|uniref:Uncharacterized protein n=1 Tax=Aspergillus ibericus CBS 121593 TaxID=1448316 RepID=A0A395GT66_9EURO|nr:hypothetical protein BO80DRAFT_154394 [Aspergillus ibericus CBS 121593]RAK98629.1 hypothetical protein BO80DRAFT_154394 [Aspergillus ibericus CBS 121593]
MSIFLPLLRPWNSRAFVCFHSSGSCISRVMTACHNRLSPGWLHLSSPSPHPATASPLPLTLMKQCSTEERLYTNFSDMQSPCNFTCRAVRNSACACCEFPYFIGANRWAGIYLRPGNWSNLEQFEDPLEARCLVGAAGSHDLIQAVYEKRRCHSTTVRCHLPLDFGEGVGSPLIEKVPE